MAALKQAPISAAIAFSPLGPWLAAGTVAEGIDDSFSTSSKLEVCMCCTEGLCDLQILCSCSMLTT